jgi:hypothetical protein
MSCQREWESQIPLHSINVSYSPFFEYLGMNLRTSWSHIRSTPPSPLKVRELPLLSPDLQESMRNRSTSQLLCVLASSCQSTFLCSRAEKFDEDSW